MDGWWRKKRRSLIQRNGRWTAESVTQERAVIMTSHSPPVVNPARSSYYTTASHYRPYMYKPRPTCVMKSVSFTIYGLSVLWKMTKLENLAKKREKKTNLSFRRIGLSSNLNPHFHSMRNILAITCQNIYCEIYN